MCCWMVDLMIYPCFTLRTKFEIVVLTLEIKSLNTIIYAKNFSNDSKKVRTRILICTHTYKVNFIIIYLLSDFTNQETSSTQNKIYTFKKSFSLIIYNSIFLLFNPSNLFIPCVAKFLHSIYTSKNILFSKNQGTKV